LKERIEKTYLKKDTLQADSASAAPVKIPQ